MKTRKMISRGWSFQRFEFCRNRDVITILCGAKTPYYKHVFTLQHPLICINAVISKLHQTVASLPYNNWAFLHSLPASLIAHDLNFISCAELKKLIAPTSWVRSSTSLLSFCAAGAFRSKSGAAIDLHSGKYTKEYKAKSSAISFAHK